MIEKRLEIFDVVKIITKKCEQLGINSLSHKKIQKLTYYVQAWSLVLNEKEMFSEKFEAWVHGPVSPVLYRKLSRNCSTAFILGVDYKIPEIEAKDNKVIDAVLELYGRYDEHYLEALTHSEKPWQVAREGMETFENSNKEISEDLMLEYYGKKLKEAEKKE